MTKIILLILTLSLFASPVAAGTEVVTVDDVLAMMSRVPASERSTKPAPWHKIGDARAIAQAIVRAARDRDQAAQMVVYDVFESGNDSRARGDFDKAGRPQALGCWQLHNVAPEIALDPARAVFAWRSMAEANAKACPNNAPDEKLAALASGHCNWALEKVRKRSEVARRISSP